MGTEFFSRFQILSKRLLNNNSSPSTKISWKITITFINPIDTYLDTMEFEMGLGIRDKYIYSCNSSWSFCRLVDKQKEEGQGRRVFLMILLYCFLIVHIQKLPCLMTEIPLQYHKHQLHIWSIQETKGFHFSHLEQKFCFQWNWGSRKGKRKKKYVQLFSTYQLQKLAYIFLMCALKTFAWCKISEVLDSTQNF